MPNQSLRVRATSRINVVRGVVLFAVLSGISCNGEKTVPLYAVRGTLLVENQPAVGALVVFHPQDEGAFHRPRGVVGESGEFQLTTHTKNDGAPAGSYAVTVIWREQPDEDERGRMLLPRRYLSPETSDLQADIETESNQLPPIHLEP